MSVSANVYDVFEARYGIDLRRIRLSQLPALAQKHTVIGRFMKAAARHYSQNTLDNLIPVIFKDSQIEMFMIQAERGNDE